MFCGVVGGLSRALEPADEGNSMIRFYDCFVRCGDALVFQSKVVIVQGDAGMRRYAQEAMEEMEAIRKLDVN